MGRALQQTTTLTAHPRGVHEEDCRVLPHGCTEQAGGGGWGVRPSTDYYLGDPGEQTRKCMIWDALWLQNTLKQGVGGGGYIPSTDYYLFQAAQSVKSAPLSRFNRLLPEILKFGRQLVLSIRAGGRRSGGGRGLGMCQKP